MKLVIFPNTPEKQAFTVTGVSATIGRAEDNQIIVEREGVGDYQASLTYSDGVWLLESLDDKPISFGEESASSLKLKTGLRFSLAGIDFLVLDIAVTKAGAPAPVAAQAGVPAAAPNANQVAVGGTQWGVAAPGTFYDPYTSFVIHTSDTLAKLGLIFAALGPIVIGIGEIIGLVLCVLSISRGRNTVRGTIMAWLGIVISLVWFAAIGSGIFYLTTLDVQVRNERKVLARLEKTALAEFHIKYAVLVDDDGDLFGEFVGPDRFAAIPGLDAKVKELADNPIRDGYNYYFDNVSADTFSVTAVPQVYGVTGKKTHWVSEAGIVVSEDLAGGRFEEDPIAKLENLEKIQTIFQRNEKTLSKKLLSAAEKNFKAGNYFLCQKVLENLRNMLPNSSYLARLSAMEKENAPFLLEAEAERLYADAENFIKGGKKDPALVMLRAIAADYPNTRTAQEVKARVNELALELASAELKLANSHIESNHWNAVEESLAKIERLYPEALFQADFKDQVSLCRKESHDRRDKYALELLAEAEKLEFEENTVLSYNTYLMIRETYGDTPAAKDIDSALERLKNQMDEKTAEKYIAEIMRNVAMSNEVEVVNMVSLLKNSCGGTKAYERSKDVLERARKDCTVSILGKEVDQFLRDKNFQAAKDRIDQILREKPEMFTKVRVKFELCLVEIFEYHYSKEEFDEALESYDRYMELNPPFPAIETAKVDESLCKSGQRFYQEGEMRKAAERFEKCYPAYLNDQQFNFAAGRANTVIKHWEPAARHLIACRDLPERNKFDLSAARSYSIVNLSYRVENRLIAMFVANLDFQKTAKDYRWIKINYATLSVTNDIENVSNVHMKIDREKTSGEIVVTMDRPDPASSVKASQDLLYSNDYKRAKGSLLTKDMSYQSALEVMTDRIRELESILDKIVHADGRDKWRFRDLLENKVDQFTLNIRELEVIDKREKDANEDIIKQLDRDIIHHNAVLTDLKYILSVREYPELRERMVNTMKKIAKLRKVRTLLRTFVNVRDTRNKKIHTMLRDNVEPILKERLTVEQVGDLARMIRSYYTTEDKTYTDCVEKFAETVNIDIDLSFLEQFLPKEKE